jgi:bifunctional UDP-N-acetylglucosamine pyrophosphorylase/glucosamine-1-phosphate N-acetyltransferase
MTQDITVVILAAGLGTRMRSHKAKVLHEAGGDTLLNHVIRAALQVAPAERIVAVVGHQAEEVRRSVPFPGIGFALQAEQRGTGHAVLCAREAIGTSDGQLMILNGDGPLLRAETVRRLLESRSLAEGGSIVTTEVTDPTGYGRIIRNSKGLLAEIVEHKVASADQQKIREINPGVYCFDAPLFWKYIGDVKPNNPAGEYYLTDIVSLLTRAGHDIYPLLVEDETELLGINTRVELAEADRILRKRKTMELMLAGVTIEFPETVTVDGDVEVAADTTLESGVQLRGKTKVGANCRIGAGSILRDCHVADEVKILPYVVAEETTFGRGSHIGPFARFRMQAHVEEEAHVGNFVELKKTRLAKGAKANHLAYLGDATIGARSNIGAGTITCNYDGEKKHQTLIGSGTFVGSNSTLVAPVKLEDGAYIAAGSVITKDVAADALAIGRAYQVEKPGWAARRRAGQSKTKQS